VDTVGPALLILAARLSRSLLRTPPASIWKVPPVFARTNPHDRPGSLLFVLFALESELVENLLALVLHFNL
jgi:hypothetical protein